MIGLNWFYASFRRTFYPGSNEQFEANTVKAKTKITAKAAPWPTTQASRDGHYSIHSESIRDEHGSGLDQDWSQFWPNQDWIGLQFFWKLAYQKWIGLRKFLMFLC